MTTTTTNYTYEDNDDDDDNNLHLLLRREDFEDVWADVIGEWMHSSVYCMKDLSEVKLVIGSVVQM